MMARQKKTAHKLTRKAAPKKTSTAKKRPASGKKGTKKGTKHTAQKSAAQKKKTTAGKKRASTRKHPSRVASETEAFWMNHGPIVFDLMSLYTVLRDQTDDTQFLYHLDSGRNDYVTWVRVVLKDKSCANSLARMKNREDAVRLLEECLKRHH